MDPGHQDRQHNAVQLRSQELVRTPDALRRCGLTMASTATQVAVPAAVRWLVTTP